MKKPVKEAESFQKAPPPAVVAKAEPNIDDMVTFLRDKTSLARFNHDEAKAVFQFMMDNGYTIGTPA